MPRQKSASWEAHASHFTPSTNKANAYEWVCKYCGKSFTSTLTRFEEHLAKVTGNIGPCTKVPKEVMEAIFKSIESNPRRKRKIQQINPSHASHPTPPPTSSPAASSSGVGADVSTSGSAFSRSFRMKQPTLAEATGGTMNLKTHIERLQHEAEGEIARTIIECNLSFHVLKAEQWKKMVVAISKAGFQEGWTGLSYNEMRTTKLDEERAHIDQQLEPVRAGWEKYGCSILSDGWSDRKKRGIINILVSSPLGTYFLRAVDSARGGKKTSGEFIYRHIRQAILEVGPDNVVQVITDNASNCQAMGKMVQEEFPKIVWTPCASHCLDLLMEDIGELPWMKEITNNALSIVTFFTCKHKALSIFREHSTLELKKPSSTRFAYVWLLLERLYDVKSALRQTVVSTMWNEWDESNTNDAKNMQRQCLKEDFWMRVQAIVVAITPFYRTLRMTDMEGATLGLLIHFIREAKAEFNACTLLEAKEKEDIRAIVESRYEWMIRPIHGLAALLHPAYKSPLIASDAELLSARDAYLPKILQAEEHMKFLQELINYNDQRGGPAFANPYTWMREYMVKPLFWWESFGYSHPHLQRVALRLLAQDCSSGACERNWSSFSLIHTKIRNKLSTRQLERLVYCRSNMRMLRAMQKMEQARQVNQMFKF